MQLSSGLPSKEQGWALAPPTSTLPSPVRFSSELPSSAGVLGQLSWGKGSREEGGQL